MKVVIKLTGSLFPLKLDARRLVPYVELFKELDRKGCRQVLVAGGGDGARVYIDAARKLGASELTCDLLGINAARMNARLLIAGLGAAAYPEPPSTIEELRAAFEIGKIVIVGGFQPGQSTNAVGIISAEAIGADLFVNATDVAGVYTEDPNINSEARLLRSIGCDELLTKTISSRLLAGSYELFDPVAVMIVKRSRIPTRILDGRDPENIRRALDGEELGTLVVP